MHENPNLCWVLCLPAATLFGKTLIFRLLVTGRLCEYLQVKNGFLVSQCQLSTPSRASLACCQFLSPVSQALWNYGDFHSSFWKPLTWFFSLLQRVRIHQVSSEKRKMATYLSSLNSPFLTSSNTTAESFADFSFSKQQLQQQQQHQLSV